MRWLDSNTDSMDLNLRQLQETVETVAKSGTRLSDTEQQKVKWGHIDGP